MNKRRIIKTLIIIIILAAGTGGGIYYYRYTKLYPSTDDAYVQAHVVNIAPRVNGMVTKVYVQNHKAIKKGEALFDIDRKPFEIALQKAEANLANTIQQVKAVQAEVVSAQSVVAQRKAQLINTQKHTHRIMSMVKRRLYPIASGDQAVSDLKVAEAALKAAQSQLKEAKQKLGALGDANANIRAAKAQVAEAKLHLKYTHVVAPTNGYVVKLSLQKGDVVTAFQEVFAIVADKKWWVTANFKETQLERVKAGQKATIKLDMYSGHTFHGKVDSISAGSGASFALLPPEDATGNWVKVTQRFPVRIDIKQNPKYPLRIGASCTVTIDTKSSPKHAE